MSHTKSPHNINKCQKIMIKMFMQLSGYIQGCKSAILVRLLQGRAQVKWEQALSLGKLCGHWLHQVRVPGKRATVVLGCCRMTGRWDRYWVWHGVRRCTCLYLYIFKTIIENKLFSPKIQNFHNHNFRTTVRLSVNIHTK